MKVKTIISHRLILKPKEFAHLAQLVRNAVSITHVKISLEDVKFGEEFLKTNDVPLNDPRKTVRETLHPGTGFPPVD